MSAYKVNRYGLLEKDDCKQEAALKATVLYLYREFGTYLPHSFLVAFCLFRLNYSYTKMRNYCMFYYFSYQSLLREECSKEKLSLLTSEMQLFVFFFCILKSKFILTLTACLTTFRQNPSS